MKNDRQFPPIEGSRTSIAGDVAGLAAVVVMILTVLFLF